MSRSYKKTPYNGDKKGKIKKRIANHKVRRSLNRDLSLIVPHGKYKHLYESYDICDYCWIYTWKQYWAFELYCSSRFNKPLPDKKEAYRRWRKIYHNK